ncbi:MAG: hypothetical protein RIQ60_462 [Pseudomonadota bacterium]|jgi:serine protease
MKKKSAPRVDLTRLSAAWALVASVSTPALAVLPAAPPQPARAAAGQPSGGEATDRLVVKYRDRSSADVIDATTLDSASRAAGRAGALVRHLRRTGAGSHVLKLDKRLSLERMRQLAADLQAADPQVDYAEPDRVMTAQFVPNDPSYAAQWHYHEAAGGINLPLAWDKSTGTGVTVAVVDTGYRLHADLKDNLLGGYDFISSSVVANDGDARDSSAQDPGDWVAADECAIGAPARNSSWHGTHVAGTIAAMTNNGLGVAGAAHGAKVLPVRVLGKCGGFTSDIADAVIWASGGSVPGVPANATPARVINLSLGGAGACDTTWQNAINSARSRNTVVVVSAGNSNADAAGYAPASCTGVITVAAVGRSGGRAFYSNYGAAVDLAAPGGDQSVDPANGVLSTLNSGTTSPGADSYAYYQGTSMAAPHVSAVAALMLARNPALTPDDVEARLKASARALPVACTQGCGAGIVDASAAIDAALAGAAPPPPAPAVVAEVEPNNSLSTAQVLTGAVSVNGTVATSKDTDYYRITIGPGKQVVATLTPNASSDYNLLAYNSTGARVATSTKGVGAVDELTLTNTSTLNSLTAFLRVVYAKGGVGSSAGAYTLVVK